MHSRKTNCYTLENNHWSWWVRLTKELITNKRKQKEDEEAPRGKQRKKEKKKKIKMRRENPRGHGEDEKKMIGYLS